MQGNCNVIKREEVRTDEAFEILERALAQPGVREMMSVYRQWESLREATQPYRQAASRKTAVALADTSTPSGLRTA
ncbi:MAG: hypothetical protein GXX98_19250 [Planctomycetes bacterium]|mgnify:FL=1|jgi:hypothetical protein|nr:hypothetical protein [Planctomycetota bacterium]